MFFFFWNLIIVIFSLILRYAHMNAHNSHQSQLASDRWPLVSKCLGIPTLKFYCFIFYPLSFIFNFFASGRSQTAYFLTQVSRCRIIISHFHYSNIPSFHFFYFFSFVFHSPFSPVCIKYNFSYFPSEPFRVGYV